MTPGTSPKRTLLHAFSSFEFGGAQSRFVQLANACGPRYRHLIVSMDGQMQAAERLQADVDWQPLVVDSRRGGALANRPAFRAVLAQHRPDLLLTYNWGAIEWVAANLPRLVAHVHVEDGFGPAEAQAQLPRRQWFRRAVLNAGTSQVVVPSRSLAECARSWWVPAQRLRYIANGVPLPAAVAARPAWTPQRADGSVRPLVVATVAGLRAEKNLQRLLRGFAAACGALPELPLRLVVIGDGPQRAELQALATALGVAAVVEFTGYLKQPLARLAEADLFALSSDTEQQPISLLEAMSLGLPVLATRVGDVAHMLPPAVAARVLCAADDAAFAAMLQSVLAQRAAWPQWAAAGRAHVRRHYAQTDMLAAWQRVFDGVAPARGGRSEALA